MNLETLDLLTQKIEKALGTIRNLRSENQRLQEASLRSEGQLRLAEAQVQTLRADNERLSGELEDRGVEASNLQQELARKDNDIASVRAEVDQRVVELNRLQDALREKEVKIQAAAERLEQVMNSLEVELDVQIQPEREISRPQNATILDEPSFAAPADLFGFPQR